MPDIQMQRARHLLLVDDEESILQALRRMLRRDGYIVHLASSGADGLAILEREPVGVIVSDQRMPGMTGSEFLGKVKERYPDTIRIVLSGYTELNSITEAINQGAIYKFLTKPWDDELLRQHIAEAFERYDMKFENARLAALNTAIVDANPIGMMLIDLEQRAVITANPALCRLLGYPGGALVGHTVGEIEPLPQDQFYWDELSENSFSALDGVETEYQHSDGRLLPVSKTTVEVSADRSRQILVLVRDLSHERRIESSLERLNAELASVFEATLDGILVLDDRRGLARINRRFMEVMGVPEELVAGHSGEAILSWIGAQAIQSEQVECELLAHFDTPESRSTGSFQRRGEEIVHWYASPQNLDGDIIGQVFVFSVQTRPEVWGGTNQTALTDSPK